MSNKKGVLFFIIVVLISYIAVAMALIYRIESSKKYDEILYSKVQEEYNVIENQEQELPSKQENLENYINIDDIERNVIGKIKIKKINLEYPILFETTEELMKIAPTRYCGPAPNGIGNLVIIGHNYYDGTQFSDLNKLKVGDKVVITDATNHSCTYKVFNKEVILPTDFSFIEENRYKTESFVTLVTCINGLKNRLIVMCKEV